MIGDHDLVISLLPYTFHPMVAKLAIEKKVNMVTASYLSPGMEELDSLAKSSGKVISEFEEIGPTAPGHFRYRPLSISTTCEAS